MAKKLGKMIMDDVLPMLENIGNSYHLFRRQLDFPLFFRGFKWMDIFTWQRRCCFPGELFKRIWRLNEAFGNQRQEITAL